MIETKVSWIFDLHSSNFGKLNTNATQVCKYFFTENFGNSVAESKSEAEAGHYLLFNIVQGAHHSLIRIENFQYPRDLKRISQIYKC